MVKRNKNFTKLQAGYLFPEINRRKKDFLEKNPNAKIISLGIGDTTEPLTSEVVKGLEKTSTSMGTLEGYGGYVPEQGIPELRAKIAEVFYNNLVDQSEVFVSDGAKCDIGRLQLMFGKATVAIQDPSYPVYVDGSVIIGATGDYNKEKKQFNDIEYMECNKENNFFPDLSKLKRTDLIYFCSPNNPTGAVATHEQLQELVNFAKWNKSIIIFDTAYAEFITDKNLPKSIYEIKGAREVAIEISSFSKTFGYTGVRLGWTIVPKELKFDDGTPVSNDWNRVMTTVFNGASRIIQNATLQALNSTGIKEMKQTVQYYMNNAKIIKQTLTDLGFENIGGINSPYIWADMKKDSWEMFNFILEKAQVVTTPGLGFGPAGQGFIRFSAFGHHEDVKEAVKRLKEIF